MSPARLIPLCDPVGGLVRRATCVRVCVVAMPLALALSGHALAADANAGGSGASSGGVSGASGGGAVVSGSSSGTDTSSSGQNPYEDNRPVVIGGSNSNDYSLSGAGTSNPLGFASGFAPSGCAPSLSFGNVADAETASVMDQPSSPQRSAGRYIQASVSGSETYTDNLNLDSSHRQSDFVTTVAPRIDACSSTGRIRGQASYQLEGVVYANHGHYNDVYNDLQGSTTIDLIENHLYLDADTEYGQQVIDPAVGYSNSNIIRPNDNKTSAWQTNLSPYFVQSLGLLGQGMLRYRYGRSIYGDRSVPDTTVQSVAASLNSPDKVEPYSWQAQVITQAVKSSGGDQQRFIDQFRQIFGNDALPPGYSNPNQTQHFDSATLQLGYRVSPTLTLTTLGGVEDKYRNNGKNDRWSAPRWQVGARWANGTNSLEVNYGHRFYGPSYSLSASHHGRVIDLSLSYTEDPSSPGLDALNNTGNGYTFGSVGSIGDLLGGNGSGYNGTNSLLDRGVYVRKRWQGRIGFDTALTQTEITGYSQRENYQAPGVPDSRRHGIEIDTRYAIRPRTSIVPSASWDHYEGGFDTVSSSDDYTAGVSVVRAISRSAEAAIGYSRQWRNDGNGYGYRENRVTLQFRKAF
ncbi:TIGR03016 family PEP-CTERM system-associated outer membrane protein [Salinisphaera hydrothermalis]|uniref:TIGR03016 family PEP-CTERM system-associated outer membrane protein n=1 Tax=Salinisphaera hydrothermalis TaxID=563188 RepID=UPI00333E494F